MHECSAPSRQAMFLLTAMSLVGTSACTDVPRAPITLTPTHTHWITTVVSQPERFSETVEVNRDAWIALHNRDPESALSLFESDNSPKELQLRAIWEVAVLYADLARLEQVVNRLLFQSWTEQTSLDSTDPVHVVARLAESCDALGTEQQGASWSQYTNLQDRMNKHIAVLNKEMDPSQLLNAAATPVIENNTDKLERTLYDPCVYNTLSRYWVRRAKETADTDDWREIPTHFTSDDKGLDGVLFGVWTSTEDLLESSKRAPSMGTLGAHSQTLMTLGFSTTERQVTDSDSAREDARHIAQAGDNLRDSFANTAPEKGIALEAELELVHNFEQKLLLSRTRLAIEAGKKSAAYSYALATSDPTSPGRQGLREQNRLILQANAAIINGREREAMDPIHKLVKRRPDVAGLAEVLSDLVVLRNINRTGESKEN